VHQVGFSLHEYIEMYGQQNIKFMGDVGISNRSHLEKQSLTGG